MASRPRSLAHLEGIFQVDQEGVLEDTHDLLLGGNLLPPRRAEILLHDLLLHDLQHSQQAFRASSRWRSDTLAKLIAGLGSETHLHRVVHTTIALNDVDDLTKAALSENAHHLRTQADGAPMVERGDSDHVNRKSRMIWRCKCHSMRCACNVRAP